MLETEIQSVRDRSQLERKELARGAWREGNSENALLILRSVLAEEMSPAVAAACYSAEAGFLAELGDFEGSLVSLGKMAPFLDAAGVNIQGTFYNQRGRAHRKLGETDEALMDYTGALALWQNCGDKNYEGAAYINLAECYLILNDIEQAYFNIGRAFAVLPEGSEYLCNAHDTKAKILLEDGKSERALCHVDKALALSGGNEKWEQDFLETRAKIKTRLMELLTPVALMEDVDDLKLNMVRHALKTSNGSTTIAAVLLGTSRQLVEYIADHNGIDRTHRKKSIIKPLR